jgi:Flp pilus assembly pilin Flp
VEAGIPRPAAPTYRQERRIEEERSMTFVVWQVVAGLTARLRRISEERGAVSVEYASLVVFIALAVIVGIGVFAVAVNALFQQGADAVP